MKEVKKYTTCKELIDRLIFIHPVDGKLKNKKEPQDCLLLSLLVSFIYDR